jgi:hypothetical protein
MEMVFCVLRILAQPKANKVVNEKKGVCGDSSGQDGNIGEVVLYQV